MAGGFSYMQSELRTISTSDVVEATHGHQWNTIDSTLTVDLFQLALEKFASFENLAGGIWQFGTSYV